MVLHESGLFYYDGRNGIYLRKLPLHTECIVIHSRKYGRLGYSLPVRKYYVSAGDELEIIKSKEDGAKEAWYFVYHAEEGFKEIKT